MRWVLVATGAILVAVGLVRVVYPPASDRWTTHGGEYEGWTVDVPPGWDVQVLDDEPCGSSGYRSTVILTGADFTFHGPDPGESEECLGRFVLAGFPRDGVALALQPRGSRIGLFAPEDCPGPPLEFADLVSAKVGQGPYRVKYRCVSAGDGSALYMARAWIGRDVSDLSKSRLERALASFRFLRPPEPA